MSTPSSTEPTPRPWNQVAHNWPERGIPILSNGARDVAVTMATDFERRKADAALIVEAVNNYDRLKKIEGLGQRIAELDEDQVRNYEQGLCFFCASGHEPIPGPRGGTQGQRSQRPVHAPDCVYANLRNALED